MKSASDIVIEYFGEPATVLSVSDADGKNLSVLIYRPIPEEDLHETRFITAGLSSILPSITKPLEICVDITGTLSPEAEKELATIFVQALHICFQDKSPTVDQLLSSFDLAPVFNTTAGLLIATNLDQLVYLDGERTTYVLQLCPLFDDEEKTLRQIPMAFRHLALVLSKINWSDAARKTENILEKALVNEWGKIIRWYEAHASNLLSNLQLGQSSEKIDELEKKLEFTLPIDLRISLSLHNGGLPLHNYTLLTTDEILTYHQNVKEEIKKHSFMLSDDKYYWPARAIPFAGDFKMNVIAVRQAIDEPQSDGDRRS